MHFSKDERREIPELVRAHGVEDARFSTYANECPGRIETGNAAIFPAKRWSSAPTGTTPESLGPFPMPIQGHP